MVEKQEKKPKYVVEIQYELARDLWISRKRRGNRYYIYIYQLLRPTPVVKLYITVKENNKGV